MREGAAGKPPGPCRAGGAGAAGATGQARAAMSRLFGHGTGGGKRGRERQEAWGRVHRQFQHQNGQTQARNGHEPLLFQQWLRHRLTRPV
ncbi:MAG TPA: hypothetical protein PK034_11765 [Rugosibacter sp.]|nr:hypothetical protein [Rugosibacter sp.]